MHESEVRDGLEKWGNVLLYGSGYGAQMLMKRLTEGSDDITAIVNSEELQCRHRQIAMDRLGEATYENIKRLGFVPDLIVARCRDLSEASGLLAWTKLGSRLICMVQPDWFGHRSWGIVDGFDIQAFCSGDGAAIVAEAPTSLQLSLS
ncbi:MAG: hypothetical protein KGH94_00610 [Candidatus Micrarchaeota archaeon]|nr:hypothetical protein [Candidatus Micrarchaeota archaeon]